MTLTKEERDVMTHALGHHKYDRNYYAADKADCPLWDGLVSRGYAKLVSRPIISFPDTIYAVTPEGRDALQSQLGGRA